MAISPLEPQTHEECLAVLNGEDLELYRIKAALRARLSAEAERYIDLPPEQWPQLFFNWDLSRESQRYALDGLMISEFCRHYPEDFCLGWVDLKEFDTKLCHYSRRDGLQELWELGFKSKLAYVIAYLANGLPITPPLVKLLNDSEIIFLGGHHRYAAAKATGVQVIPIYVEPSNFETVARTVQILCQKP